MKKTIQIVWMVAVIVSVSSIASAANIETVHVGNSGNTGELSGAGAGGHGPDRICGAVSYEYNIGKYEVTAGQYRDFLNAVDPNGTNPYGLYNANMDSSSHGCQITWNSGSSTYDFSGGAVEAPGSTAADWENRPVNYVSWYDALRFSNWLTNGQGSGDTESGSYDITGGGVNSGTVTLPNHAALAAGTTTKWLLTTEDEWYKAAYYSGSGGTYYDYPTSSDTVPGYVNNDGNLSNDTGTSFADGVTDPGNYATYDGDGGTDGIGPDYYRTEVGEWENSDSPYGTFDQGGNVWEWNEAIIDGSFRGIRGGSFFNYDINLLASYRYNGIFPTFESNSLGFRVSEVPEPATMAILMLGGIGILRRRRKQ